MRYLKYVFFFQFAAGWLRIIRPMNWIHQSRVPSILDTCLLTNPAHLIIKYQIFTQSVWTEPRFQIQPRKMAA